MLHTQNCIVCAWDGRKVEAKTWTGWVALKGLTVGSGHEGLLAGFCANHRDRMEKLPHRPEIHNQPHCYGWYHPDMEIREAFNEGIETDDS